MKEDVIALLREWEVPEAQPYLAACNILDIRALKLLNEKHAEVVFPVEAFGIRLKFMECLETWKSLQQAKVIVEVDAELIAQSSEDGIDVSQPETSSVSVANASGEPAKKKRKISNPLISVASNSVNNLDVRVLLEADEKGRAVLDFYDDNNWLKARHRDVLVSIVVDAMRRISHGLKNDDFQVVAMKIIECFPTEDIGTYYLHPGQPGNTSKISIGKIPRRYRNAESAEKALRQSASRAGPSRAAPSSVNSHKNPYDIILKAAITPNIKEAYMWLETDASTNDWKLLKDKWAESAPLRLQKFWNDKSPTSIADYIEKYSVLTHPSGITLLEVDFNIIYPGKEMLFVQKWDNFVRKTSVLAACDVNDDVAKNCLALSKGTQHPGSQSVLALGILPALCPPTKKVKSKTTNKQEKITIASSRAALFLHVTDCSKLTTALKERRQLLFSEKKEYQPFLVFVGPKLNDIKQSYVDVAGILYRLNTPAKAIDACFKAVVALHMTFPTECMRVWMLLQRVLYDISTSWDNDVPMGTISSYKALPVPVSQ